MLAFETDAYVDWKVNDKFTLSIVGAYADPGKAVAAVYRPHEELRIWDGVPCLQFLRLTRQLRQPAGPLRRAASSSGPRRLASNIESRDASGRNRRRDGWLVGAVGHMQRL